MARGVLFLAGIGSIGWGLLCLVAGSVMPEWTGLAGPEHGELYIESLSVNVGYGPRSARLLCSARRFSA